MFKSKFKKTIGVLGLTSALFISAMPASADSGRFGLEINTQMHMILFLMLRTKQLWSMRGTKMVTLSLLLKDVLW